MKTLSSIHSVNLQIYNMLSKFLFLLSVCSLQLSYETTLAIRLSEFYPFGEKAEDNVLRRTLDGSSPLIKLVSSVFPFYGQEYDQLYVSCTSLYSVLAGLQLLFFLLIF